MSLLSRENKRLAVREVCRVLRRGGELDIADFGSLHTRWGRWVAPLLRRFERISDNLDGLLPALFREAGLENVEVDSWRKLIASPANSRVEHPAAQSPFRLDRKGVRLPRKAAME